MVERNVFRHYADTEIAVKPPGIYWGGAISLECKAPTGVPGSGAAVYPELDDVFQAMGLLKTAAATTVTYDLSDYPNASATNVKSVTLQKEEVPAGDGNLYKAAGVSFGNTRISGGLDKAVQIEADWIGKYVAPTDCSLTASPVYNAGIPFAVAKTSGNPFRFHSYDMIVRSWTVNLGITVSPRPSFGDAVSTGYIWPCFIGREGPVTLEAEIECVDQSAFALWAKYVAATAADGQIILSEGSRDLTMNLRNVQFGPPEVQPGQPNLVSLKGTAHRSGANSAFDMVFS